MTQRSDLTRIAVLWPFVRPHRRAFAIALGILGVSFALELLAPWLVRRAIDGPLANAAGGADTDPAAAVRELTWWSLALLATVLASTALGYRYALLTASAGQATVQGLRERLFRKLLEVDPRWHDRQPTGRVVTRVTTDVENLDQLVTTGALQAGLDLVRLVGVVAALWLVDAGIGLLLTVSLPVLVVVTLLFRRRARIDYAAVRTRLADQNAVFGESISGARTVRAFGREQLVIERHAASNSATRIAWDRTVGSFARFFATVDACLRGTQAGLLLVGGLAVLEQRLSAGILVQAWLYFQLMARPIRELGERFNVLQAALASVDRIADLLELEASPPEPELPAPPPRRPASLSLRGVRFGYDPGDPVLLDLDLEIPAGTTCALVGPTGAGKSTILGLCARLHDPDMGEIELGEIPLARLEREVLRQRIAVVPQEPVLFRGSILDNVRLFDDSIDERLVRDALHRLGAGIGLLDRVEGLHAEVGEHGNRLSRGERQLVAFARALVRDPDVLLLDEPTASVDSRTEAAVQSALRALRAERTCLVVAHRLSTVREADQIAVVDAGRIVDRGSHAELAARPGRYRAMLDAAGAREANG